MTCKLIDNLHVITHGNIPVITTELLANLYGAEVNSIQQNFKRNVERFINGKHLFKLEGDELREYKNRLTESQSVAKHTRSLILWTERGAARHAKMLETDKAWEVFEQLEDCYFNLKESKHLTYKTKSLPGKLSIEQQEAIKQLVINRGRSVPQEHQAKATITLWSALKSHFGCSYKEIPEDNFTEALSLAARVSIEGEFIGRAPSQNSLPAISGRVVLDYADGSVTRTEVVASNCFIGDIETLLEHLEKRGVVVLTNEDERRNFVKENLMRLIN
uniref:ORF6N domain-containing protein n=1 Tax=Rhodnius prolixus TaxID=13249 RepID=T1IAC5_RHOPR